LTLLVALALWLPQNAAHEGAHILAARQWGAKLVEFVPWPSKKLGYFTWAHVRWRWENGHPGSIGDALTAIAPQFTNTVVLILCAGLYLVLPESPWGRSILTGWAITNFVDGAYNLSTVWRKRPESARTDGWRFVLAMGVKTSTARVGVLTWWILFGGALFAPIGW
jgi:hypothetical protein